MTKESSLASATASSSSLSASSRSISTSSSQSIQQQYNKFYIQANAILTQTKEQLETTGTVKEEGDKNTNAVDFIKIHQKIMITLDTITKLIFGLSSNRKAQVVVYGGGAIELIIGLVRVSQVLVVSKNNSKNNNDEEQKQHTNHISAAANTLLSKPIMLSSLKAIKTCVLRNPAGRCRCRSANVLEFLKDILNVILVDHNKDIINHHNDDYESHSTDTEDALLVEQVFTTLAAICLGDDLNALQASTQFRPFMARTKAIFARKKQNNNNKLNYDNDIKNNDGTTTTIHHNNNNNNNNNQSQVAVVAETTLDQKLQYLEKLFSTIENEQSTLLSFLQQRQHKHKHHNSNNNDKSEGDNNDVYIAFIQNVNNAEMEIRHGYTNYTSSSYKQSLNHYNHALSLIEVYCEYTMLLHPLVIEIRMKRGMINYELGKMEDCLVDTNYLLEDGRLNEGVNGGGGGVSGNVSVLKLHTKALVKAGREEEAKESIGKLSLLCPDDEEVTILMEELKL